MTNPKYAVVAVEHDHATFEVDVEGTEPLTMQWYHGDTLLAESSNSLTIDASQ